MKQKIMWTISKRVTFSFKVVSISEIEKELRELNSNKVTTFDDIVT